MPLYSFKEAVLSKRAESLSLSWLVGLTKQSKTKRNERGSRAKSIYCQLNCIRKPIDWYWRRPSTTTTTTTQTSWLTGWQTNFRVESSRVEVERKFRLIWFLKEGGFFSLEEIPFRWLLDLTTQQAYYILYINRQRAPSQIGENVFNANSNKGSGLVSLIELPPLLLAGWQWTSSRPQIGGTIGKQYVQAECKSKSNERA